MKPATPKTPDQRTVTVGSKSIEAMWAKLAKSHHEEVPPVGAMSARQYAEKFKTSVEKARKFLARLADSNRATATPVRMMVSGQMRTVMYYLPKRAA